MLTPRQTMTAALTGATETPLRASHAQYCEFCGDGAPYGFSVRNGEVWTCTLHRGNGEAMRVGPGRMDRVVDS